MGRLAGATAPLAVRLADLDREGEGLAPCPGYDFALVFLLKGGSVIGEALVPVVNGSIRNELLLSAANDPEPGDEQTPPPLPTTRLGNDAASVTVAVCTRDRSAFLKDCLESIQGLRPPPAEVMVIDNCPTTAETRELVSSCPTIRYALCDEPGLDRARNLALRLAGGSIVAFIDDDVRVHPGWLERIVRNFNDPIVGVATGITLPAELETEAQITLERIASFIKGFERREFTAFNADPFHVAGMGAGSSMAIRTSILGEVGVFNEQLDGGTPTLSGGDHEFFSRTLRRGYRIVYDNSAIAWHLHRRTENEALKTVFGYGVGVFAWWTCTLVREREYSLLLAAPLTLIQYHARRLVCSFTGSADAPPAHYAWAELRGALTGPFAYFRSLLTEGRRQ